MYALCSDAMLKAITRQARNVDEKVKTYNTTHTPQISIAYFFDHLATEEDTAVMVTEPDFVDAHNELVPSVSADELRHYERVRKAFEGAGKKDDEKQKLLTDGSELNGAKSNGTSAGSGKGKEKAAAVAARRGSVNIAEGGFGDAEQDDDLYS